MALLFSEASLRSTRAVAGIALAVADFEVGAEQPPDTTASARTRPTTLLACAASKVLAVHHSNHRPRQPHCRPDTCTARRKAAGQSSDMTPSSGAASDIDPATGTPPSSPKQLAWALRVVPQNPSSPSGDPSVQEVECVNPRSRPFVRTGPSHCLIGPGRNGVSGFRLPRAWVVFVLTSMPKVGAGEVMVAAYDLISSPVCLGAPCENLVRTGLRVR